MTFTTEKKKKLSIIVPLFNEEENIEPFLEEFSTIEGKLSSYEIEILFVNDGSEDGSREHVMRMRKKDPRIRYIEFSRNFGKEAATTAGLHHATGDAALLIDADLQHPIRLIPEFVSKWEEGVEVVIGVRNRSKSEGVIRKTGSYLFYKILNVISDTPVVPQATDFRLVDRAVIDSFNRLTEHSRVTRGLIDWLGFRRELIYFDANERERGIPAYRLNKLVHLAIAGLVTSSTLPLRLAGYIGALIAFLSGCLGIVQFLDRFIIPWGLNFTGTAILATITLFLVGIILMCLGLLAFYLEHTFRNAQGRPLYVVREYM